MTVDDLAIIAAVVAIVTKAVKSTNRLPDDFLPVIAIAVGILCSAGLAWLDGGTITKDDITVGLVAALTASGVYSGVKAMTETEPPTIEVPAIPDPEPPVETPAPKPTPKPRKPRVPKVPVNEGGML